MFLFTAYIDSNADVLYNVFEVIDMALTEAKRKANDKYIASHYKQMNVSYPADFVDAVRACAAASGESLAGYVRKAIEQRMQQDVESK